MLRTVKQLKNRLRKNFEPWVSYKKLLALTYWERERERERESFIASTGGNLKRLLMTNGIWRDSFIDGFEETCGNLKTLLMTDGIWRDSDW